MNPNEDIGFIMGDIENCLQGGTVKEFWMPVVQGSLVDDQYLWLDDREGLTTPLSRALIGKSLNQMACMQSHA